VRWFVPLDDEQTNHPDIQTATDLTRQKPL
jgi:hypothetical protein